jgi:alkylation response protein AidB-like acyl-CoA dehydrogenase
MTIRTDEEILQLVEEFTVDRVAPRAARIDVDNAFFPDLVAEAADIGLQSLHVGAEGEIDLSRMTLIHETTERIAAASASVATVIAGFRLISLLLKRHANPVVVDRWFDSTIRGETYGCFALTEPQAGTDLRGLQTVATRTDGGWVLNGHKMWIGNADVATFSIVLAKIDSVGRDAGMVALVVDMTSDGVVGKAGRPLSGFRGMPNGTLDFTDVRVPADHALNVDGFKGMIHGVNMARIEAASYACGILRGCLEASVERAASREAFGRRIGDLPSIQMKIGRMATDYRAARELTLRAAESYAARPGGDQDLISMAKMFASDAARRHSDEAMQIHAASGIPFGEAVGRMNRDSKITQIFDGTSEVHETMLGRRAVSLHDRGGLSAPFLPR